MRTMCGARYRRLPRTTRAQDCAGEPLPLATRKDHGCLSRHSSTVILHVLMICRKDEGWYKYDTPGNVMHLLRAQRLYLCMAL